MSDEEIGFLFMLIHDKVETKLGRVLSTLGLTLVQARVLIYLHYREGRGTTQKDIEIYLEVSHPTTNGILKRLEEKGLIVKESDPRDRRQVLVYPTEKERVAHKRILKHLEELRVDSLCGLSAGERREFAGYLRQIYSNLKD